MESLVSGLQAWVLRLRDCKMELSPTLYRPRANLVTKLKEVKVMVGSCTVILGPCSWGFRRLEVR